MLSTQSTVDLPHFADDVGCLFCLHFSCIEMRVKHLKDCCGHDYYKNLIEQVSQLTAVTPAAHQVLALFCFTRLSINEMFSVFSVEYVHLLL